MRQIQVKSRVCSFLVIGGILTGVLGCSSKSQSNNNISSVNFVQAGNRKLIKTIGNNAHQFTIMGDEAFNTEVRTGNIEKTGTSSSLLLFGMPFTLMKQPMVFGSVITQVSDQNDEELGDLKLADIPPLQVIAIIQKLSNNTKVLSLLNCNGDCSKTDDLTPVIDIPIVGIDSLKKIAYVDLSSLGQGLDLTAVRDGDPLLARFKSKSSITARFDFSQSTLVFDIESHLVDKSTSDTDASSTETVITNRWFLKPETTFNPQFISRKPTPGIGFFLTNRSSDPLIERWDFDHRGTDEGIKYYIKHVPVQYQAAFAGAFEVWNDELLSVIGKKIFAYEFIPDNDPRNDLLVTGDVRYNILEWDLKNRASYGGLGPSLANQYSGEIFQSNVLVQGPNIVEIYTKWFNMSHTVTNLRSMGKLAEAERVLKTGSNELKTIVQNLKSRTLKMKFNDQLHMRIRSQQPSLEDPVISRQDFDIIPDGNTFETYIMGYFHDMVTHELGHNLGLRHNFKGSLGAEPGTPIYGRVSRSVMEYLGRDLRNLDTFGKYDLMAIQYGYSGMPPEHTDWFCTDEDVADLNDPTKSAECTKDDETSDPFSYFQTRLDRAVNLLIAKGQTSAPNWKTEEMKTQLEIAFTGLGSYAVSAEKTSGSWTNFFNYISRPTPPSEIKAYVLKSIKLSLCDPNLETEITLKDSDQAKSMAKANLTTLRRTAEQILQPIFSTDDLSCLTLN